MTNWLESEHTSQERVSILFNKQYFFAVHKLEIRYAVIT